MNARAGVRDRLVVGYPTLSAGFNRRLKPVSEPHPERSFNSCAGLQNALARVSAGASGDRPESLHATKPGSLPSALRPHRRSLEGPPMLVRDKSHDIHELVSQRPFGRPGASSQTLLGSTRAFAPVRRPEDRCLRIGACWPTCVEQPACPKAPPRFDRDLARRVESLSTCRLAPTPRLGHPDPRPCSPGS